MSPEQVLADPPELDTRSDVYALGVILYELLAGRLPYQLEREPCSRSVRAIREEDPARLSSITRSYRGDVETIVAKALEKDKTRRYASAADAGGGSPPLPGQRADHGAPRRAPVTSCGNSRGRHRALVTGSRRRCSSCSSGASW